MNFPEVMTIEWAQNLASRPRVVTEEDRRRNRRQQRRLSIAEMDEHAMAEWRRQFPQDVLNEREFFVQRRAKREKKRVEQAAYREDRRTGKQAAFFQMELKESSTWSSHDERWVDASITMEKSDTGASESEDDEE
ncbi:t-complex protein 1 subunit eta [Hordeum vulgare]|nr:t-complex protein 1 subunit eta [Hordeum vulgare]